MGLLDIFRRKPLALASDNRAQSKETQKKLKQLIKEKQRIDRGKKVKNPMSEQSKFDLFLKLSPELVEQYIGLFDIENIFDDSLPELDKGRQTMFNLYFNKIVETCYSMELDSSFELDENILEEEKEAARLRLDIRKDMLLASCGPRIQQYVKGDYYGLGLQFERTYISTDRMSKSLIDDYEQQGHAYFNEKRIERCKDDKQKDKLIRTLIQSKSIKNENLEARLITYSPQVTDISSYVDYTNEIYGYDSEKRQYSEKPPLRGIGKILSDLMNVELSNAKGDKELSVQAKKEFLSAISHFSKHEGFVAPRPNKNFSIFKGKVTTKEDKLGNKITEPLFSMEEMIKYHTRFGYSMIGQGLDDDIPFYSYDELNLGLDSMNPKVVTELAEENPYTGLQYVLNERQRAREETEMLRVAREGKDGFEGREG